MVAIKDGKPHEVPRLICETTEDKVKFLEGRLRREIRGLQDGDFDRIAATFRNASDEALDRLMLSQALV